MSGRLGIIAGKGGLPLSIAKSALARGENIYVVRVEGLADAAMDSFPGSRFNLGKIGSIISALRKAGCERVTLAGYITRPDFAAIQFDEAGQALLPKIIAAASEGDAAVLYAFITAFEDVGFHVVGAKEAYPDLLCPEGRLTDAAANEMAVRDLTKAFHLAGVIGREDIGQACIVRDGLVLALEAQEGTDAMVARAGGLDVRYRIGDGTRTGVLVKRAKPGQDLRVDLPTIGVRTIKAVAEAGLAGIGLEADRSLIIEQAHVVAAADVAGIFIVGLSAKVSE